MKKFLVFTLSLINIGIALAQYTSIHHEQSEYYKQFGNLSIAQWDSIQGILKNRPNKHVNKANCNLTHAVYGWHPYWMGSAYTNYDFSLLSTFCYFSYELDPSTGNYQTIHGWNTDNSISMAQAAGCRVELCVTNFGSSNNNTFLTNPTAQQTLINNLITLLNNRNADGVNIDFEGVSGNNRNDLTNFMINLSNQLKAAIPGASVTMATYSVDWNNVFDFVALAPYVDQFIIMGYGYYYSGSSTAGPTAPLYSGQLWSPYNLVRSVEYHLNAGVPHNKLLLGLPYYGREWETTSGSLPSSTTGNYTSSRTYKYIKDNTSGNYSNRRYDYHSYTPYYIYNNGNWRQALVDDEESLTARYKMIKQQGIGGIGIWALGYDDGYTELWDAIQQEFTDCGTVPCTDTIYDMGGPYGNYRNNEDYTFTIQPTGASSLQMVFTQFDVEQDYDTLWIYDGTSTSDPLIGAYTNPNAPNTVYASGNALTLRFWSDGATTNAGWKAIYQCTYDTISPVTTVDSIPLTGSNINVLVNDSDNVGGSGVRYRLYQVIDYNGYNWYANDSNGFFSDNFDTSAIASLWTNYAGVWSINNNYLEQTDEANSNTNISAYVNQNNHTVYMYEWEGKISGSGTNKRAGLHFMCDDASQTNRGNSYFVWFREDDDKLQFYKVTNNTFTLEKDVPLSLNPNQWYNFKVVYDKTSGDILVYLNNQFIDLWTDSNPLQNGDFISFRNGNCMYTVNNMKVYHNRPAGYVPVSIGQGYPNDVRYQSNPVTQPAGRFKSYAIDNAKNISDLDYRNIYVNWLVSVNEENSFSNITVYPNPFNGDVSVINPQNEVITQVELMDLTGKENNITTLLSGNKLYLSQLNLSKGVYIIILKTKNHRFVQRIIKI
tara:strand:- start:38740 stop:41385 length:2646 start_codon:yes stop_codon:yes gene_type:complete